MQVTKRIEKDLLEIRKKLEETALMSEGYIDCGNLCGACALGALLTYRYFKSKGFKPVFLYHPHHCLIQVNGRFFDLTATQYGYPEIFTGLIGSLEFFYGKTFKQYKHPGLLTLGFYKGWKKQNPYWLLKEYYE